MRIAFLAGLICLFSIAQMAVAESPPKARDRQVRRGASKTPKPKPNLRRFLRSQVERVEWEDVPFGEVIEWLSAQGDINVVVRWNVLMEHGIDEDSPVSLRLKKVRVATLLAETLAQLSDREELRYLGIGPTLIISTRADLNKKLYVKVYPVNDLLFRIPDFTSAPTIDIQQGGGGGGQGSAQQNPFQGGGGGGGGGDDDRRSRADRINDLIELIKVTIEPESWRDNGGEGTIKSFNNKMIVIRANFEVHQQLGGSVVLKD
ncbi:MAG: hypothetical protein KAV82_00345 [Phycisphaerae bacterium]|nr:hypothetical protein [Phycisphaerae bacterium]